MGIAVLPLRVRSAPFEPPWALLNRVAVRHRLQCVRDLLSMTVFSRRSLAARLASGHELEMLAAVSGVPEEHARSSLLRITAAGTWLGPTLIARSRAQRIVKRGPFCALCLREDMERRGGPDSCRPHRRWWWDIAAALACATHGVLLTTACSTCGLATSRFWLSPGICPCGHESFLDPPIRPVSGGLAFEAYLERRLRGGAGGGGEFLDSLTPFDAALAVTHVGRVEIHGGEPPAISDMSPLQLLRARAAGFEALSEWPGGFHGVLNRLTPSRTAAKIGPARMFHVLYYWLQSADADVFEPLRREIGTYYLSKWPATEAQSIFGAPATDSEWVTLGVLAKWAGCSVERARTLAERHGAVARCKLSRATPILREDAKRLAELLRASVDTDEARRIVGVRGDTFKSLLRSDLIEPVVRGAGGGNRFDPAWLQAFIVRLTQDAPLVAFPPDGASSVVEVARETNRAVVALVEAIRDGRIAPVGRLADLAGLDGLLVMRRDAIALPYVRARAQTTD